MKFAITILLTLFVTMISYSQVNQKSVDRKESQAARHKKNNSPYVHEKKASSIATPSMGGKHKPNSIYKHTRRTSGHSNPIALEMDKVTTLDLSDIEDTPYFKHNNSIHRHKRRPSKIYSLEIVVIESEAEVKPQKSTKPVIYHLRKWSKNTKNKILINLEDEIN